MMQALKNIYQLGLKELHGIRRDVFLILLIVFSFTLQIKSAADSATDSVNDATVAVVDEDHSALSERLTDAILPPHFLPPVMLTRPEIDVHMDDGTYTFVVVIPVNFQKDVEAGYQPDIQLNVDATRMSQAFVGTGYLTQIFDREVLNFCNRKISNKPLANYVIRNKYNPNLTASWFETLVQLMNNVTMLAVILTGSALIRERERGTLEHLLVLPVTPFQIMISKIWSMGLVILVSAILSLFLVVKGFLGLPTHGSILLYFIGAALHLFAMTSMGIFLACIASSMPQLGLLMILIMMPMNMLSGGNTPRESMPYVLQRFMMLSPTTHFVNIGQIVLCRGGGFRDVLSSFIWLFGIGSVLYSYSLYKFRQSLNNG